MNKSRILLVGLVILLFTLSVVANVFAQGEDQHVFNARLLGADEVPLVETLANGHAHFKINKDHTEIRCKLVVTKIVT